MTTLNLGEPLDVYASCRKRLQLIVCECGKRSVYLIKEGNDKVHSSGSCIQHINYSEHAEKGSTKPTHIPSMPKRFVDTDLKRLQTSMQIAALWNPTLGKPGLMLHGMSGIGKTRVAWNVVNRIWKDGLEQGFALPINYMSMREFERTLIDSFETHTHGKELKKLCEAEFLVLDDLGKERLTSRMATDIFAVLDHRTEHSLPTIITTNFSGKAFIDRFLPQDRETGLAIARRIRDYFEIYGMTSTHENQTQ